MLFSCTLRAPLDLSLLYINNAFWAFLSFLGFLFFVFCLVGFFVGVQNQTDFFLRCIREGHHSSMVSFYFTPGERYAN